MESDLAHIIMGEAGLCSYTAMIAVAYIYSRNSTFYGYQHPDHRANLIARNWFRFTDTSNGAVHLFSHSDLQQYRVQRLIRNKEPTNQWICAGGLRLYAY